MTPTKYLSQNLSDETASKRLFEKCRRLFEGGDFHEVINVCTTTHGSLPRNAEYWEWIGFANLCLGEYGAAYAALAEARQLSNGPTDVRIALGDIALRRGERRTAFCHYLEALDVGHLSADEHVNLEYLAKGVGEFGLAALQTEWQLCRNSDNREYYNRGLLLPRWQGEPLEARSLFVHWADGFGDNIQHIRFIRNLVGSAAHLTLDCPHELYRLFQASLPNIEIILADDDIPREYDYHTSVLSLAAFSQRRCGSIPAPPYLFAGGPHDSRTPAATFRGEERLIGICWRGSNYDKSRSFDVRCLSQLSNLGRMVSLQKSLTDFERVVLDGCRIENHKSDFVDFLDTANCIARLDCVITIDTAIAHLAGAMAKPTVLLLAEPVAPMWACSAVMADFYPSMVPLVKPRNECWREYFSRIMPTLTQLVANFQPVSPEVNDICDA